MSKPPKKPLLPPNCAGCIFSPRNPERGRLCRRHAPTPGEEEFELAHWPEIRPTNRCGDGEAVSDDPRAIVSECRECVHWFQPDDAGVKPDYRRGMPAEWWAASGYCTRRAPSPSTEEKRRAYWKVTHESEDWCGDGRTLEAEDAPEADREHVLA